MAGVAVGTKQELKTTLPEYDQQELASDVDTLGDEIRAATVDALRALPDSQKPSEADMGAIADAFAGFIALNRTGTREDYLARARNEPDKLLVQEDTARADKVWEASVAWARYKPIDVGSVHAACRYVRGNVITPPPYDGSSLIKTRPLAGGGYLMVDGPGGLSAYEIMVRVTVPAMDGKGEYPLELGVLVTNDYGDSDWSVVELRWIGLPEGVFVNYPFV